MNITIPMMALAALAMPMFTEGGQLPSTSPISTHLKFIVVNGKRMVLDSLWRKYVRAVEA